MKTIIIELQVKIDKYFQWIDIRLTNIESIKFTGSKNNTSVSECDISKNNTSVSECDISLVISSLHVQLKQKHLRIHV